ncbi:GvpL/GvpF family gas vesicle protein [Actinocorallia libanotica]|uniref:GvpL/GvpF family gas vesicle protein n=1 Tax=Actinocorallia libanotica TaxID=46162 RepID=A0ABN1Q924_9ACTN
MTVEQEEGTDTVDAVCYVYGVVPADAGLSGGLKGTRGGEVFLVEEGDVAAVVSEFLPSGPLGSREDLLAHEGVVSAVAERTTVLPLRFGAVVTTPEAVAEEMLVPHHDWFAKALKDLKGRHEFIVTGTYVEETVLREVLEEQPEVRRLQQSTRDMPEEAAYYDRIRLGELIVQALEGKRQADTEALMEALSPHALAVAPREPKDEDTAADVAFLVDDGDRSRFEREVGELEQSWEGRIRLRLLGPLAPYDFVPQPQEV